MSKQESVSADTALSVPFLWPMAAAAQIAERGLDLYAKNLKFLAEEQKIRHDLRPKLATANRAMLDLRTMVFRDYTPGKSAGLPTIVDAPYAGHTAMIADYHTGQSLIETLLANGLHRVFLTDWKSATEDMKDFEIDQYLAELNVCVDDLGEPVNLVGLCQGGWLSAMYAARYPEKVASLVLAGSPIDTDAGDGPIKRMAHTYPTSFYQELVAAGGGLMRGSVMLQGWKGMNPGEHYIKEHIDLYEHMDDPAYLAKEETFESWYENPIDLPGRFYLQAIVQLFKENRLAKGTFVGLGKRLNLKDIVCPVYLLAGADDDITTKEQVFDADKLLGTPKDRMTKALVPGGHVGLFMGGQTLKTAWPKIARWIAEAPKVR
jgi:polyhydroxyalkanoate depolymerase